MKIVVLWVFGLFIIGLLFAVGRYLLKEHKKMYGVCWKEVVRSAEEYGKSITEQNQHVNRLDEIMNSVSIVKDFTNTYDGLIDLDIPFSAINPEWEYFKLLRIKLRNRTSYTFPIYMEFLERVIFLYNADKDYAITTRQLITYTNHIFDEYFVTNIKKRVK